MQTLQQLQSGQLAGATKIKLSCGLTQFPEELFTLADTLEHLDLSGNKLSILPAGFSQFQKLKIAFFSDNLFTVYPEILGRCESLEMVGFKANQIEIIPENALNANLRWLILTNNQIKELPKSIGSCTRMQKLMLAGNQLQTLPPEMAACTQLGLLRISANKLTFLPEWLLNLPNLAWLAFAGNPFSNPQNIVANLPAIAWEKLKLQEQLGEGASGNIYRAIWQAAGEEKAVAVKIFKGEVTSDGLPQDEMFATMLAGSHPNLIPVLGKIEKHAENKSGLVLELLPPDFKILGNPPSFQTCTRDTLPAETKFTLEEVLSVAKQIASVAAHLHQNHINHGDLYAHNILKDHQSKSILSDFGAATVYGQLDTVLKSNIQKIEVKAFGYLLEDLLTYSDQKDADLNVFQALQELQNNSLQEDVEARPAFAKIQQQLNSINKSLN